VTEHINSSGGVFSMLVAKRDPFHNGAQGGSFHPIAGHEAPARAPRLARAMSAVQIAGALLAIPVGLGSAYSMYRANFSVETTCQSLRANIVTVLDKQVDASARHRLVRRDVEEFERSCGGVCPDATAAFKDLLAAERKPVPVVATSVRPAEKPAEIVAAKTEPRAEAAAKIKAANVAVAKTESEPVQREAQPSNDAVWLAAVRHALVTHPAQPAAIQERAAAQVAEPAAPVVQPLAREARPLGELRIQPATTATPAPLPPLPAPTWVTSTVAPTADAGHPVPPGSIPVVTSAPKEPEPRSRFGELVAQIPLLGSIIDR
jgi:hypothetical protein